MSEPVDTNSFEHNADGACNPSHPDHEENELNLKITEVRGGVPFETVDINHNIVETTDDSDSFSGPVKRRLTDCSQIVLYPAKKRVMNQYSTVFSSDSSDVEIVAVYNKAQTVVPKDTDVIKENPEQIVPPLHRNPRRPNRFSVLNRVNLLSKRRSIHGNAGMETMLQTIEKQDDSVSHSEKRKSNLKCRKLDTELPSASPKLKRYKVHRRTPSSGIKRICGMSLPFVTREEALYFPLDYLTLLLRNDNKNSDVSTIQTVRASDGEVVRLLSALPTGKRDRIDPSVLVRLVTCSDVYAICTRAEDTVSHVATQAERTKQRDDTHTITTLNCEDTCDTIRREIPCQEQEISHQTSGSSYKTLRGRLASPFIPQPTARSDPKSLEKEPPEDCANTLRSDMTDKPATPIQAKTNVQVQAPHQQDTNGGSATSTQEKKRTLYNWFCEMNKKYLTPPRPTRVVDQFLQSFEPDDPYDFEKETRRQELDLNLRRWMSEIKQCVSPPDGNVGGGTSVAVDDPYDFEREARREDHELALYNWIWDMRNYGKTREPEQRNPSNSVIEINSPNFQKFLDGFVREIHEDKRVTGVRRDLFRDDQEECPVDAEQESHGAEPIPVSHNLFQDEPELDHVGGCFMEMQMLNDAPVVIDGGAHLQLEPVGLPDYKMASASFEEPPKILGDGALEAEDCVYKSDVCSVKVVDQFEPFAEIDATKVFPRRDITELPYPSTPLRQVNEQDQVHDLEYFAETNNPEFKIVSARSDATELTYPSDSLGQVDKLDLESQKQDIGKFSPLAEVDSTKLKIVTPQPDATELVYPSASLGEVGKQDQEAHELDVKPQLGEAEVLQSEAEVPSRPISPLSERVRRSSGNKEERHFTEAFKGLELTIEVREALSELGTPEPPPLTPPSLPEDEELLTGGFGSETELLDADAAKLIAEGKSPEEPSRVEVVNLADSSDEEEDCVMMGRIAPVPDAPQSPALSHLQPDEPSQNISSVKEMCLDNYGCDDFGGATPELTTLAGSTADGHESALECVTRSQLGNDAETCNRGPLAGNEGLYSENSDQGLYFENGNQRLGSENGNETLNSENASQIFDAENYSQNLYAENGNLRASETGDRRRLDSEDVIHTDIHHETGETNESYHPTFSTSCSAEGKSVSRVIATQTHASSATCSPAIFSCCSAPIPQVTIPTPRNQGQAVPLAGALAGSTHETSIPTEPQLPASRDIENACPNLLSALTTQTSQTEDQPQRPLSGTIQYTSQLRNRPERTSHYVQGYEGTNLQLSSPDIRMMLKEVIQKSNVQEIQTNESRPHDHTKRPSVPGEDAPAGVGMTNGTCPPLVRMPLAAGRAQPPGFPLGFVGCMTNGPVNGLSMACPPLTRMPAQYVPSSPQQVGQPVDARSSGIPSAPSQAQGNPSVMSNWSQPNTEAMLNPSVEENSQAPSSKTKRRRRKKQTPLEQATPQLQLTSHGHPADQGQFTPNAPSAIQALQRFYYSNLQMQMQMSYQQFQVQPPGMGRGQQLWQGYPPAYQPYPVAPSTSGPNPGTSLPQQTVAATTRNQRCSTPNISDPQGLPTTGFNEGLVTYPATSRQQFDAATNLSSVSSVRYSDVGSSTRQGQQPCTSATRNPTYSNPSFTDLQGRGYQAGLQQLPSAAMHSLGSVPAATCLRRQESDGLSTNSMSCHRPGSANSIPTQNAARPDFSHGAARPQRPEFPGPTTSFDCQQRGASTYTPSYSQSAPNLQGTGYSGREDRHQLGAAPVPVACFLNSNLRDGSPELFPVTTGSQLPGTAPIQNSMSGSNNAELPRPSSGLATNLTRCQAGPINYPTSTSPIYMEAARPRQALPPCSTDQSIPPGWPYPPPPYPHHQPQAVTVESVPSQPLSLMDRPAQTPDAASHENENNSSSNPTDDSVKHRLLKLELQLQIERMKRLMAEQKLKRLEKDSYEPGITEDEVPRANS